MAAGQPHDAGSTGTGVVIGLLVAALLGAIGFIVWGQRGGDTTATPPPTPTPTSEATPTQTATDDRDTFEAVYSEVSSGVVRVETTLCDGTATGSGALVARDLVVTAAHVVADHSSVQLLLGDQSGTGEVIGYAEEDDLALVRISRPLTGHVFDIVAEPAGVGSEVAAIGFPLSGPLSMAGPGIVSAYGEDISYRYSGDRVVEVADLMRTSVPTNRGNSGGPIVDRRGDVVGVVSGGAVSQGTVSGDGVIDVNVVDGIKFAVPADRISQRVDEWQQDPEPLEALTCDPDPDAEQLVTALVEGAEADAAVAVLTDYFEGINTSDYERAYEQLAPARRESLSLEQFEDQQSTSVVLNVVVQDAWRDGDDLRAVATFVSIQAPEYGPEGLDCAYWVREYQLVPGGPNGWTILRTADVEGRPAFEACT